MWHVRACVFAPNCAFALQKAFTFYTHPAPHSRLPRPAAARPRMSPHARVLYSSPAPTHLHVEGAPFSSQLVLGLAVLLDERLCKLYRLVQICRGHLRTLKATLRRGGPRLTPRPRLGGVGAGGGTGGVRAGGGDVEESRHPSGSLPDSDGPRLCPCALRWQHARQRRPVRGDEDRRR